MGISRQSEVSHVCTLERHLFTHRLPSLLRRWADKDSSTRCIWRKLHDTPLWQPPHNSVVLVMLLTVDINDHNSDRAI